MGFKIDSPVIQKSNQRLNRRVVICLLKTILIYFSSYFYMLTVAGLKMNFCVVHTQRYP